MGFKKQTDLMSSEQMQQIEKVINILKIGGKSEKTINNYVCAIKRFLKYFGNKYISQFEEEDIIEYIKNQYINKNRTADTYNMNICAIKFFYIVNFKKDFNNKLLPRVKTQKKLPSVLDKNTFIKILDGEQNLKHKCWLLLAYCSGLRAEEIASVKISNIYSQEHQLKVLGKRNKERLTVLPDITIEYLRNYYKHQYCGKYNKKVNKTGYLFEGNKGAKHINEKVIVNYFMNIKKKYNLDKNITLHSLRHSFATNFIKSGGDPFILKSMLGHTSLNTTNIYIHMGRDFNNLKGVNYEHI